MISKSVLSAVQWLDRSAKQNDLDELLLKNPDTGEYQVVDLTPGGTPFNFKQFERYHIANRTGFLYCTIDWVRDDYDENVVSETRDIRLKRFTIHLSYSGLTHMGVPFAIIEGGKDLLFRGLTEDLDVIIEDGDGSRAVYALPNHKLQWIAGKRKEALRMKLGQTVTQPEPPASDIPPQYVIDLMKINKHGVYYRKQLDGASVDYLVEQGLVESIPERPTACRLTTLGDFVCKMLRQVLQKSANPSSATSSLSDNGGAMLKKRQTLAGVAPLRH